MSRKNQKQASTTVKDYGPRGTHVRSAEGSAIGRSRADAADLKRLVRSGAQRANRLGQASY